MEQSTSTIASQSWLQDALKKGLILGFINLVIFILMYVFVPGKLVSMSYAAFAFLLTAGYSIYQGIMWRREIGGYIEYGAAFKYIFVLMAVASLVNAVFGMVLPFIDPGFPDMMAQAQLDTSVYWAERMGAPSDALDQMRENFDLEAAKKRFTIVGQLSSFGIGLIVTAVITLILALFVKKNIPENI